METAKNKDLVCPICWYPMNCCQCLYSGEAHPDRDKITDVVLHHLYLLSHEELEHIKRIQRVTHVSYSDPVKAVYLENLEKRYIENVKKRLGIGL